MHYIKNRSGQDVIKPESEDEGLKNEKIISPDHFKPDKLKKKVGVLR